jgi:hypothetical protein
MSTTSDILDQQDVLERPSKQNRVPMMAPERLVNFVDRPAELRALKHKLFDTKGVAMEAWRTARRAKDAFEVPCSSTSI